MRLFFNNGSAAQKAACRFAAHNLLNYPFATIPLYLTVEFVADPVEELHNEYAATTWTYNDQVATIKIKNTAGSPETGGVNFLQESFVHELAHALFAALPTGKRTAIARMFGAESDDIDELFPENRDWRDLIGEGIVETFKDAFLPRRFRVYTNRTNHSISISRYPEFRGLWRPGGSLGEGSGIIPIIDPLDDQLESPIGSPFVKWPAAAHIGNKVLGSEEKISWRSGIAAPSESGAINTEIRFTRPFAASIWRFHFLYNAIGETHSLIIADNVTDGGSGYKLVLVRMKNFEPIGQNGLGEYTFRLERWQNGSSVVLDEATGVKFSIGVGTARAALSLVGRKVAAWRQNDYGIFNKVLEVTDDTFQGGYPGMGAVRSDPTIHTPGLSELSAGPIVPLPNGEISPGGLGGGRVLSSDRVRG